MSVQDQILHALTVMKGSIEHYGKATPEVLAEYTEQLSRFGPHAVFAIKGWTLKNDVWPPLPALLRLAQEAEDGAREAAEAAARTGRPETPVQRFVAAVRNHPKGGAGYVKAFLTPGANCRHSHAILFTYAYGRERIARDFGDLARKMGVTIEHDPFCDEMLTMHNDGLRRDGRIREDDGSRRRAF